MTSEAVWACARSVDVEVPASFAWQYMTDVRNWSDPPAEFTIDGPFTAGARGVTTLPGQPDRGWTIDAVTAGRAYTLHTALAADAFLLFHWHFDPLSDERARLTQRLELCGPGAASYIDDIRSAFEPNLEPGMQRIARLMRSRAVQDP
jgi:hypothetical protein